MSETKICEWCDTVYARKPRRSREKWEAQRTCSKRCAGLLRGHRVAKGEYRSRYRWWEHKRVAEEMIGRPLLPGEQVHHKNGDPLDNRPENLEVVTLAEHGLRHSKHPRTKRCAVCRRSFTPHPTKRARQQTCGRDACKRALLSIRNRERVTSAGTG